MARLSLVPRKNHTTRDALSDFLLSPRTIACYEERVVLDGPQGFAAHLRFKRIAEVAD